MYIRMYMHKYTTPRTRNSHLIIKTKVKLTSLYRESVASQSESNGWHFTIVYLLYCMENSEAFVSNAIAKHQWPICDGSGWLNTYMLLLGSSTSQHSFKKSTRLLCSRFYQNNLMHTEPTKLIQTLYHQPGGKISNALRCHPPCG